MQLQLSRNNCIAFRGDCRGVCIRCDKGVIWLTQTDDHSDHLLTPGEKFVVRQSGTIILEARRDACITLQHATPA